MKGFYIMEKNQQVTAEFEEVKEKNLPADPKTFTSLRRHELMVQESDEHITSIKEELDIDTQLGLKHQAEITANKALMHDIDKLTSSNDFFEISSKQLSKLFQMGSLKRKCYWANLISFWSSVINTCALPITLDILFLALIYPMMIFSFAVIPWKGNPIGISLGFGNVIAWIGMIILLIFGIGTWDKKKLSYLVIDVKIDTKPLSSVSDPIPYGAKLKVLEAKKTGIFKDFVFAIPEFTIEGRNHLIDLKKNFPPIDPAILGVTEDKRMYMIVYWDLDKDVERIVKNINNFKKYKLGKV